MKETTKTVMAKILALPVLLIMFAFSYLLPFSINDYSGGACVILCLTIAGYLSLLLILLLLQLKKRPAKDILIWCVVSVLYVHLVSSIDPVHEILGVDSCLDSGYVWDYDRKTCRKDCQTWNKQDGCTPLSEKEFKE